jgi:hypothetical protein
MRSFIKRLTNEYDFYFFLSKNNIMIMNKILVTLYIVLGISYFSIAQGGKAFSAVANFDTPNFQDRFLQVDITNNLALNDAYTIETWVYIPSTSDSYVNVIDSYTTPSGFGGYELGISNGKVAATVYGLSVQSGVGNTTITYNTWQHIAATYDGSDELKVYLNGVLDGTFNLGIDNFNFGTELYIGANGAGSPNEESILIDEVRIWEDVRTSTELSDNLYNCLNGQESDLVLYYSFEQTGGLGFVTDQGPLGYHATIIREQTNAFVTGVYSCCSIDTNVTVAGNTISALYNESGASYQWIDCNNGNSIVLGETNQSFTSLSNGSFAAIITYGGCIDTTNCTAIISTNVADFLEFKNINVFPNPVINYLTINFEGRINEVRIYDLLGEIVQVEKTNAFPVEKLSKGIYLMDIYIGNQLIRKRFEKL